MYQNALIVSKCLSVLSDVTKNALVKMYKSKSGIT